MECYRSARGKLPPELSGLMTTQLSRTIDEANLGLLDSEIAKLYFIDRLPLADIADRVGYDRSTVGRHARAAQQRMTDIVSRLPQ